VGSTEKWNLSICFSLEVYEIDQTQSYVPSETSWNKLLMLLIFGIEPIVNLEPTNPDETDPQSGVYKARKDGEDKVAINPGQYHNEDNPGAHEKWTAQQIWQQTDGKIDIFCTGLGTTGTVIGNSSFLKSKKESLQVVGVMRAPDQYVPGVRTDKLLKLVGFDWQKHVDSIERVDTAVSYQLSMELSRQGIVVGPSSGLALAGLLQYLTGLKQENKIEELRDNQSDDVVCVFLCPDGPLPYLDEYFKYLDSSNFPLIQNEELMQNKP
jgi:cysteine synthase